MYPAINIGPLVFPTAGLVYLVGAWISLSLIERAAVRVQQSPDSTYGLAATSLLAGLIGARFTFVILYWPAFRSNLLAIVWPLNSGYNLWGGLIIALASAVLYGRAKRLNPTRTLDALAPGLISFLIFVSLADFLAGPGFGEPTRVPWAITQFSVRRHPVQLYEILAGAAALFVWWRMSKVRLAAGQLFLLTASIYSGGRLFVDAYRQNAWLTSSGYHILQIISFIIMIGSLYLLGRTSKGIRTRNG